MKISVFGTGYVGLVTGACLANLGHEVLCVDIDAEKIKKLEQGEISFYEPGLKDLLARNLERGRIKFTTDGKQAAQFGDVIFNCVGTPGNGDGSADLQYVFEVAKMVGEYGKAGSILVNKSTVPPGTARKCQEIVGNKINVVANPEFLREGMAIRAFNYPDKIVIGANSETEFQVMRKVYSGRLRTYLPIVETNWETSELIKYANNSFLATKISYINEVANICDKVGADVKILAMALGLDYRISPRFLNAGVGYGGSCFPKDVKAIIHTARENNYEARLFEEVSKVNERQKHIIIDKIDSVFGNNIGGKTFCILGLSFKPKTSDMRDAPSIYIINQLLQRGAKIKSYDPKAMGGAEEIFLDRIEFYTSAEQAAIGSDALVIITEWDEFRNLDLAKMKSTMVDNKIFDGRNIYEPEFVREEGLDYYGIGRK